jgi:CDP-diacylglycerol---serine O-phosphatidyltransferase
MTHFKKAIPSIFTSLGLICGCISIVMSVSQGNLTVAGYFIIAAAIFDFIDGFTARITNGISAFGKQLDSLADVVSFGAAPAMIMYRLMILSYVSNFPDFDVIKPSFGVSFILFSSSLIAVFSALRLAKFNLDPEQTYHFKGLPTPANALFIAALGFLAERGNGFPQAEFIYNRVFLLAVTFLSCYFLVSNIRMFSLKFSSYGIQKNLIRYLYLLLAVLTIVFFGLGGLAAAIVLYIIMSLLNNWFVRMD